MKAAATVEKALGLAEVDPHEALRMLGEIGEGALAGAGPVVLGLAYWARGRASRHLGRRMEAGAALRLAVETLSRCGAVEDSARAAVSLALERIDAGCFDEAIRLLDGASAHLDGTERARLLIQKGLALQRSGRSADAVECWDEAVTVSAEAGAPVEAAIARQNRGIVRTYRGDLDGAEDDLRVAREAFASAGHAIRAMEATHNLGFVAARRGDLPRALALFDEAQAEAGRLGSVRPQALLDRVEVTLNAGLTAEARILAESTVRILERDGFDADVPEACLLAAGACEQDDDLDGSAAWAARAAELFEMQERPRWGLLARLAIAVTDSKKDAWCPEGPDRLLSLAAELREAGWFGAAVESEARAARLLIDQGRHDRAGEVVERLIGSLRQASALGRTDIRLVEAAHLLATGDVRGVKRALSSAYRSFRIFQATLGSIELRSRGGGRAEELVAVAVALAEADRSPEGVLYWSEAVRQTTRPAFGVATDPEMLSLLGALRDLTAQMTAESVDLSAASRYRRRQAALEELIRRRSRHAAGIGTGGDRPLPMRSLMEWLEGVVLIDYVIAGNRLWAAVVEGGSCRLIDVADLGAARRAVAGLRMALRTAVSSEAPAHSERELREAGLRAERALLRPLGLEQAGPVVIVPDGPLGSVPWSLLPHLAGTEVTVAPSASEWARAGRAADRAGHDTRVLVVAGPGLQHGDDEIEAIARTWHRVTALAGADATVDRFLRELPKADLVHVAAHGTHRGDNPLLSGIRLHDGYVTGYELATVHKSVELVVLSCCDIGMSDTSSGIGLAQVLTQTGVAGAIASVSPIPDRSAAALTPELHRHLAGGAAPAAALNLSRAAAGGPLRFPSAAGLVCFGRG